MCRVGIEARHAHARACGICAHGMCAICITLSPRAARLVENKLLCKRERFVQRVRVHHHDLLVTFRALAVHLKRQHKEIVLVLVCWVCCVLKLNYSASFEYSLALRSVRCGDTYADTVAIYGRSARGGWRRGVPRTASSFIASRVW